MGLLDKILGKEKESQEVPNLEELMNHEGDIVSPPADFYVKKLDLRNEGDVELAINELSQKNIIILNLRPLIKQQKRLKAIITKLRQNAEKLNGDIALLQTDMIILTPQNVKIVKTKPKQRRLGHQIS